MRRFLIGFLACIGGLALLVVILPAIGIAFFVWHSPPLPGRMLLTADWREGLGEASAAPSLLNIELRPRPTITDIVLALDAAAADPRVGGLLVRLAETSNGMGATQELRDAVKRFRASRKFAIAYADSFGELSSGNEGYYLATAFDEIDLQAVGLVGLTGLAAQVPLARDLLASLGIDFEVQRRAEFKTAMETLTDSQLTGPNREQLDALLDTLNGQLVAGIADGRRLTPDEIRSLIDRGPFSAEEARSTMLVDALRYDDETAKTSLNRLGRTAVAVDLADYAAQRPTPHRPAATVALVRAAGLISRGQGSLVDGIAADELAGVLRGIAEDREFRAVVLRLDSGGGSAVASETVRHAVELVRASGKPVVVSMGSTAASGAYWIALAGDRIVAQPGTLTGSIGVVAGKPVLADAWRKLGVNWAEITRGDHADIWSVNKPYSADGKARVDDLVGWLYGRFTSLVAESRSLSPERAQEIAKGRVWAGATALELGLVDELGGLDVALGAVRRLLQLPPDAALDVQVRPEEEYPARRLLGLLRSRVGSLGALLGAIWPAAGTALSLAVAIR
jgi:protease-4